VSMVKARGVSIGVLSFGREMDSSRGSMHLREKSSTGGRRECQQNSWIVKWGLSRPHTLFLQSLRGIVSRDERLWSEWGSNSSNRK